MIKVSNASSYQKNYWFPKVAELQGGEYCKGCGISKDSIGFKTKSQGGEIVKREFTGLRLDKINNDGNHTIGDNKVSDFQLLCISCNRIKNPVSIPKELETTQSEATNNRAEKPLMNWLKQILDEGQTVKYTWFVAEGSFKFDISPETIERRYSKKYFQSDSSPFTLDLNNWDETIIVLRNRDKPKINLDIKTQTPTPSKPDKQA